MLSALYWASVTGRPLINSCSVSAQDKKGKAWVSFIILFAPVISKFISIREKPTLALSLLNALISNIGLQGHIEKGKPRVT